MVESGLVYGPGGFLAGWRPVTAKEVAIWDTVGGGKRKSGGGDDERGDR